MKEATLSGRFPSGSAVKEFACNAGATGGLGLEDPLEKEVAPHSSILSWRIPWTEEAGGLQSMGSQELERLSDYTATTTLSGRKQNAG